MTQSTALSPFKHRTFAILWLASLVSTIGSWIHAVGAGWMMTSLSDSPFMVSLVQSITTLPIFLFALPAGALGDIYNRRQLLLVTTLCMFLAASVFALMVWYEWVSATSLLLFTFLLGAGMAFSAPAWQAVIPNMVPKSELPQAVALGGISINLSRAIGPALAGMLITTYGIAFPFIVNVLCIVFIVLVLKWWQYQTSQNQLTQNNAALPKERFFSAMRSGVSYASHSAPLKATMWHVLGFMFFANAYWGLLPIIAKDLLGGDAAYYGFLMALTGFGAVIGALFLPKLKQRMSANQLVALGSFGTCLVTGFFAFAASKLLALMAGFVFGMSWILVLASVNVSAQQALPDWIKARGLALFMMVFYGSMSLGSALWGMVADATSIQTSVFIAALGGMGFIFFSYRSRLQQGADLDLTPSQHWPAPMVNTSVSHDVGPVIIQVAYLIKEEDRAGFLSSIYRMQAARKRQGAYNWGVYEDVAQKGRFIEHFMENSWADHLRHHERVSGEDKAVQETVYAFHSGDKRPEVMHFIGHPSNAQAHQKTKQCHRAWYLKKF